MKKGITPDDSGTGYINNAIKTSAASDLSCACLSEDAEFHKALPGYAVVVTKWIGLYGSVWIAEHRFEELRSKYPAFIMEYAIGLKKFINVDEDIKIARKHGDKCVYACGEGGLYAALWDITRASSVGISADFKDIPVRQETVELCEFYDINPYKLRSDGALIVVTPSPDELLEMYDREGIPASVIGYITEGNKRIITYGEEEKHIQKPAKDELYKILC